MESKIFDNTDVYNDKIKPQLMEIKELCIANKIPFFASFMLAADKDEGDVYKNEVLTPSSLGLKITGCDIIPLMCIAAGSKAVPASEVVEIEFD